MNDLRKEKWNKKEYSLYIEYLKSMGDESYKKFHSKLTTTQYEILGIRVPIQRKIAKEICKGDIVSFLECSENEKTSYPNL